MDNEDLNILLVPRSKIKYYYTRSVKKNIVSFWHFFSENNYNWFLSVLFWSAFSPSFFDGKEQIVIIFRKEKPKGDNLFQGTKNIDYLLEGLKNI